MFEIKKISILSLVCLFFFSFQSWSQEPDEEKIKSLKTAFITEALELTPHEAQKFWPIYNKYEKKNDDLYDVKWCEVKNGLNTLDKISDEEAEELLSVYVQMKEEKLQLRKEFIRELEKMISAKKILALKKAERDFHKLLLEKYSNKN